MKIEVVGDLVNLTGMKYNDFTSMKSSAYNKLCDDAREYERIIETLTSANEIAMEEENLAYVNNLIDVLDQLGRQINTSLRKPEKQESPVQDIVNEIVVLRNPFDAVANALRNAVVDMIDTSVGEEVTTRLEDMDVSEIPGLEALIENTVEKAVEAEVENQLSDYEPKVSADDVDGLSDFVEHVIESNTVDAENVEGLEEFVSNVIGQSEITPDDVAGLREFVAESVQEYVTEFAKGDGFRAIIREELKKLLAGIL